jgi:hypothetical protein
MVLTTANIPEAISKPNTTIMIDGNPSDWVGIPRIAVDPSGDEDSDYDLTECYVTNDGSNLYFMIKVSGTIQYSPQGDPFQYAVLLDTDQNKLTGVTEIPEGETLDIGFDYAIAGPFPHALVSAYLCNIIRLQVPYSEYFVGGSIASFSGGILEFSCPLSVLDYPTAIDMVFMSRQPWTEFAPDQTGSTHDYVTYNVAPPLIKADGDGSDWIGISPLVQLTDPEGDAPNGDDEDIINCRVTNNGETLYLRMDIKGDGTETQFPVMLDTDTNVATGLTDLDGTPLGIGADYMVLWEDAIELKPCILTAPPIDNLLFINTISGNVSGSIVEIAIPLAWIGNPDKIDIVFIASLTGSTDFAGPMRYQVHRPRPVGGVVMSTDKLEILTPYLALAGLVIAISAVIVVKRRR